MDNTTQNKPPLLIKDPVMMWYNSSCDIIDADTDQVAYRFSAPERALAKHWMIADEIDRVAEQVSERTPIEFLDPLETVQFMRREVVAGRATWSEVAQTTSSLRRRLTRLRNTGVTRLPQDATQEQERAWSDAVATACVIEAAMSGQPHHSHGELADAAWYSAGDLDANPRKIADSMSDACAERLCALVHDHLTLDTRLPWLTTARMRGMFEEYLRGERMIHFA